MANILTVQVYLALLAVTLCHHSLGTRAATGDPAASSAGDSRPGGSGEPPTKEPTSSTQSASITAHTSNVVVNRTQHSGATASRPRSRPRQAARKSSRTPSELLNYHLANLLAYNNTPPHWVTHTRDLLLDLAEHEPGDKLLHLLAIDGENDTLEYALRPAPAPDASAYLAIDSSTGDIRFRGPVHELEPGLYHLNVEAFDGRYPSILELHVYLFNSSDMQAHDWAQLRSQMSAAQSEASFRNKTEQLYGAIIKSLTGASSVPANLVLPNYVNPGLVPVASDEEAPSSSLSAAEQPAHKSAAPQESQRFTKILAQLDNSTTTATSTTARPPVQQLVITPPQDRLVRPDEQPALLGVVAVLSATLVVALVVLLFVVPVSVRRLRQRLKVVESRHEQLSHQSSNGSSTMTRSDACSSHLGPNSMSELTLNSVTDRSVCCRQSSLDETVKTSFNVGPNQLSLFQSLNQVGFSQEHARLKCLNNGAIRNPLHCEQLLNEVPLTDTPHLNHSATLLERIYDNIEGDDDGFYSTLGPVVANSPTCSEDSTRSLERFLSLPARHSSNLQKQVDAEQQQQQQQQVLAPNEAATTPATPKKPLFAIASKVSSTRSGACTIARATQVALEQANRWELDRHRLKFLEILDTGQFGLVWRCKLRQGRQELTVAVKTLRNNSHLLNQEQARQELLQEIDIMKALGTHPNVVRLLHCCTLDSQSSQRPVLLVMEFAELGKLQSYLKSSRLNHSYGTTAPPCVADTTGAADPAGQQQLVARDLLKFIYHIAQGMEYISSLCILHRDLASRNILMSRERICKIGDFGMARKVGCAGGFKEEELTYERSRDAKVPVRWMAPEVILNNQFTTSSDVYSFGVLMWEIVTLGSTPYTHLKTNQVIEEVAKRGERPEKPEYCHEQLYRIMSQCWSERSADRPSFRELVGRLDQLLMSGEEYIQLDQYPDHDYYNIQQAAVPYEII